jgi:iduronate 2-sulfatase
MKKAVLTIILFQFFLIGNCQKKEVSEDRPNVLFIMTDDLSASLNCYGVSGAITPNIDKLASQGVTFNHAYCQAALCNPSRSSIMTGKYPKELGIWTNHPHFRGIFPTIKTLPQYFKDQGYYVSGIGKIYHNWGQSIDGDPLSWTDPQRFHWAAHFQDWYIPGRPYQLHSDLKKGPAVQCEDVPDEAYLDGRITNAAIDKLRELQEVPFFLAIGFWKPHLPYNAPKKYWDMYDRKKLPPVKYNSEVDGVSEIAYVNSNEARSYSDIKKEGPIPEDKKQELRHGYYASISYVDAQVGKIINELNNLGLSKNTIIVLLSDHGYHAGEHGQFGKWTNFEIGTKVPLIIASPNTGESGKMAEGIVELIDLYPTLVELCNLPSSINTEQLSGVSLVPILKNVQTKVKSYAVSQITRPIGAESNFEVIGTTVRTDSFRYNMWVDKADNKIIAEEMYDLSVDPLNVKNLAGKPKMKAKKNMYLKMLHKFINE